MLPLKYTNSRGRQSREMEKIDRMEAQRKERELRNQQAIEVSVAISWDLRRWSGAASTRCYVWMWKLILFILSFRVVCPTYLHITPIKSTVSLPGPCVSSLPVRSECALQARRKRQEEIEKLKQEEAIRKQQVSHNRRRLNLRIGNQSNVLSQKFWFYNPNSHFFYKYFIV